MPTSTPVSPTPPPANAGTPTQASMPTLGSILGTAAGVAAAGAFHLDPTGLYGGALVSAIVGLFTAAFHWFSTKLNIPLS